MPISNVTSTGLDSVTSLFGTVILILIAFGIMSILFYISSDISKYRRIKKISVFFFKLFSFASYGLLTVVVIAIPLFFGWQLITYASDNPGNIIETGKWIGIIFGGIFGFAGIGYVTKNRIWKRIFEYHKINKQLSEKTSEIIDDKDDVEECI